MGVLALEQCLIAKLPSLFSPEDVYGYDDDQVNAMATELPNAAKERAQVNEKKEILETGLRELARFSTHGKPRPCIDEDSLSNDEGMCIFTSLTVFKCADFYYYPANVESSSDGDRSLNSDIE